MTRFQPLLRPVPALDPAASAEYALAGGWLRFDVVECLSRDAPPETMPADAAALRYQEPFAVLGAPRAVPCGLTPDRPLLMGVLNVTPDSFSDGGQHAGREAAVSHGLAMAEAGADIVDIGGESTRPGAEPVTIEEELARVIPVIEGLMEGGLVAPVSIDTRNAEVARRALAAGARMVNDVSALTHDPEMAPLVAEAGVPVCLMHALGDPRTMQDDPRYDDVLLDIFEYLEARIAAAAEAGIARANIIADPGIGFGKTRVHNLTLIRRLSLYHALGVPILLGLSRKRFIGGIAGEPEAARRMPGSIAAGMIGLDQGAQILRVHDVAETRQALALWLALRLEDAA